MLHRTRGIALKTTNYSENSIVAQVYTELFGLQSYLISGAKKPKAKIHVNILQPLHLLDMVVYYKENSNLQRIKEAHQTPLLQEIPLDIVKSSIALFLNEVLYKVLRHQNPDKSLFDFLANSIEWLDKTKSNTSNFHLVFLVQLSRHLGFLPFYQNKKYLDLAEGIFTNTQPPHTYILEEAYTNLFRELMSSTYDICGDIKMDRGSRKYLLEKTLDLYRLHTTNFGEIKSLAVLEEIFY